MNTTDTPQPTEPVPDGDPYDMTAERAGREMWEYAQAWRERHGLTRVQYLWIATRMLAVELRQASLEEVEALKKANEQYGNGSGEKS